MLEPKTFQSSCYLLRMNRLKLALFFFCILAKMWLLYRESILQSRTTIATSLIKWLWTMSLDMDNIIKKIVFLKKWLVPSSEYTSLKFPKTFLASQSDMFSNGIQLISFKSSESDIKCSFICPKKRGVYENNLFVQFFLPIDFCFDCDGVFLMSLLCLFQCD